MSDNTELTNKINDCKKWLIYINESTVPGEFAFVPFISATDDPELNRLLAETVTGFIVRGKSLEVPDAEIIGFMIDDGMPEEVMDLWFENNREYIEALGIE